MPQTVEYTIKSKLRLVKISGSVVSAKLHCHVTKSQQHKAPGTAACAEDLPHTPSPALSRRAESSRPSILHTPKIPTKI